MRPIGYQTRNSVSDIGKVQPERAPKYIRAIVFKNVATSFQFRNLWRKTYI